MDISDHDRKKIIIGSLSLVVALVIVSLWHYNYNFPLISNKKTDQAATTQIQTDPKASAEIMKQVVSQEDIQKQLDAELRTDIPIVIPAIPDKNIKTTSPSADKDKAYLEAVGSWAKDYSDNTQTQINNLFSTSISSAEIDNLMVRTQDIISHLYETTVPTDAVAFHKATIILYGAHLKLLQDAKDFLLKLDNGPWPDVYQQYGISDKESAVISAEFTKLKTKYNFQ